MTPYETGSATEVQPPKTSGLAIASLITGLTCIAPAAVICGHIALSNIKHSAGKVTGSGIAMAGLVLGYVSIIAYLLAVPTLFIGARAWKKGSDRAACIMTQRNIQQAVRSYQSVHGLQEGSPLDMAAVQAETQSLSFTCPTGVTLKISDVIPPAGTRVATCPHDHDLGHAPTDHAGW